MKKVLITGALGQIGSELTERLRNDLGEKKCYLNRYPYC